MLILLLLILLVAAAFGGFGHSRWGYRGWSPLGVILVIVVVLYLTGNLHRFR